MKTVSLKLAKQLKKAGFPQDSAFWWTNEVGAIEINFSKELSIKYEPDYFKWEDEYKELGDFQFFAAPTAEEILDRLPAFIADTFTLLVEKGPVVETWTVAYRDEEYYMSKDKRFFSNCLAEAAGKMWLYLKENKLIE